MVKKADLPKHIIDTAFALAAEQGWRDLSLAAIAEAAKVPLSTLYPLFPSKQAIIKGFADRVDATVVAADDLEGGEAPARDRLFDVLMRRFEAMQPQREAIGAILQDQCRDPLSLCCGCCRLKRSMATMLEAAGFSTSGLRGLVRIEGLSAIYLSALRVWLRDDSEDMAKTMASLDKQLRRADALVGRFASRRMRRAEG